jgi:hypothetical protein
VVIRHALTPDTTTTRSFYNWKFATRQLPPVHELKPLVIIYVVEMFQPIIYTTLFTIVISNKLLNDFMKQDTRCEVLIRWQMFMQSNNFNRIQTVGINNIFADMLSGLYME